MLFGALVGSHNFGSSGQHCPECGEDEFSKPMKDRADLVGDVNLTPREIEVIRFVALGYNQEELGTELSISPRTVEKHVKHVMEKLCARNRPRSEEHTSELQSLMRISYAVFCLKKKKKHQTQLEPKQ